MKVKCALVNSHKIVKLSTHLCPRAAVISWGSRGARRCNAISINPHSVRGFIGLARRGDVLLPEWGGVGGRRMHFKARSEVNQAGHWYYYVDRVHHRRCGFLNHRRRQSVQPHRRASAAQTRTPNNPVLAFRRGRGKNLFLRTAANQYIGLSSEPPQKYILDIQAQRRAHSRRSNSNKMASRERSQIEPPPPRFTGSITERQDSIGAARKTLKRMKNGPLTHHERQALFDDFLKWYRTEHFRQP